MFCSVYFTLSACIYVIVVCCVYVVNTLYIGKRGLYIGQLSRIEKNSFINIYNDWCGIK